MAVTHVFIASLACLTGGAGRSAALASGWDAHPWGSSPSAESRLAHQRDDVVWYEGPPEGRTGTRVFCTRASRVLYGYQSDGLVAVQWHWDGRTRAHLDALVARSEVPPTIRLDVQGRSGHAWVTARPAQP